MRRLLPAFFGLLLLGIAVAAQADSPNAASLSMTVRDRDGKPLVGVWLTLQPLGRVTMTNGKGAAKFTSLLPGPCAVSLAPGGYHPLVVPITLAANPDNLLDVALDKEGASAFTRHDAAGDTLTEWPIAPTPDRMLEYLVTPPVPPGSGPAWRTAQEGVLREAVLRRLFTTVADTRRFQTCYFAVEGGKEPDAALLRRFQDSKPPIRALSVLTSGGTGRRSPSRHRWISLSVSSLRWTSDTSIEVIAGSSESDVFSSVTDFLTCTLRNGWWVVTGLTMISI